MRPVPRTQLLAVTAVLAIVFSAAPFVEDALQAEIPRKCCDYSVDCVYDDLCCQTERCQNPDDVGQYTCWPAPCPETQ
jgi:hypothetical protein